MWINAQGRIYGGDCVVGDCEATDEEVAAWEESRKPTVADQLAKLDADNALTQRNLRDLVLILAQALKVGGPVDLTQLPGVKKAAEVEAEAAALRAQL